MRGQSLIELLIALGIFVVMVSVVAFLLIDSYISNLQASQNSKAIFLAEEGMEAARSIRDNSWDNLTAGPHGLTISENNWIFQGELEDISDKLPQGKRVITIGDIDEDRKKVTSKVSWQVAQKENKIELITYLTDWQEEIEIEKPPKPPKKEK